MSDVKLLVICGHGAGDSGACGNGYQEQERVRALGAKIATLGGDRVMLGDTTKNWYRSNLISSLNISKDYKIVELHMDGSTKSSAKGGHVIIKKGYMPDKWDVNLGDVIAKFFPGYYTKIVGRDDLANINRAATKGYNYRLLECGFISNKTDITTFNTKMEEIAKGILGAFGIPVVEQKKTYYRVQTGAFRVKLYATNFLKKVQKAGFEDAYIKKVGEYYKIQIGAYTVRSNAEAMLAKVKAAGFSAFITTNI